MSKPIEITGKFEACNDSVFDSPTLIVHQKMNKDSGNWFSMSKENGEIIMKFGEHYEPFEVDMREIYKQLNDLNK